MSDPLPSHFDYLVIGTALRQSVIAAALAKAGHSVLQVDENAYYGGHQATLSLRELVEWADKQRESSDSSSSSSRHKNSKVKNVHLSMTGSTDKELTPDLLKSARSYNISLSPSIVPASGPFVTAMVRSGVAKYSAFKLVDSVGLYNADDGTLRPAATTKEDIFKDKSMSLMDKRRLMKFVMAAANEGDADDSESSDEPFQQLLEGKYSLPAQLRNLLMYAATLTISQEGRSGPAVQRLRKYIRSNGRFGRSPFLLGQYGGVGEIIQGFCRVAAVFGAVHMLGRPIHSLDIPTSDKPATIKFQDDEAYTVDCVVYSDSASEQTKRTLHRAIVILSSPVHLSANSKRDEESAGEGTQVENALFVVPPSTLETDQPARPVFALMAGDGSFSAPAGQYVLYLASVSSNERDSAQQVLEPSLRTLVALKDADADNSGNPDVLLALYYSQEEDDSIVYSRAGVQICVSQSVDETSRLAFAEVCDSAIDEAQACFEAMTGEKELFEQAEDDADRDQDEL